MKRKGHPGGEKHHLATLTDEQVRNMRTRWAEWKAQGLVRPGYNPPRSIKHLAREFGCTPDCADGIIWKGNRKGA